MLSRLESNHSDGSRCWEKQRFEMWQKRDTRPRKRFVPEVVQVFYQATNLLLAAGVDSVESIDSVPSSLEISTIDFS